MGLEALVLEELEAPWFGCLEELEALVGLGWLEGVGKVMLTAASSEFVLPGKPPLPGVFSTLVVQPRPKRWKRLRTGGEEACPMVLALPLRKMGPRLLSPFLTALALAEGSGVARTQAPGLAPCWRCSLCAQ